MARLTSSLIAALMLAGCISPMAWAPDDQVYVLVRSTPEDATITFPDGTSCQTPCRLSIVEPVTMTVARVGYAPYSQVIDRSTRSPLSVELTPVGRSIEVEEVTLPDL